MRNVVGFYLHIASWINKIRLDYINWYQKIKFYILISKLKNFHKFENNFNCKV
jgi:hypothetical protein